MGVGRGGANRTTAVPTHNPFAFDGRQQARLGQHRAGVRCTAWIQRTGVARNGPHDRRRSQLIMVGAMFANRAETE